MVFNRRMFIFCHNRITKIPYAEMLKIIKYGIIKPKPHIRLRLQNATTTTPTQRYDDAKGKNALGIIQKSLSFYFFLTTCVSKHQGSF